MPGTSVLVNESLELFSNLHKDVKIRLCIIAWHVSVFTEKCNRRSFIDNNQSSSR